MRRTAEQLQAHLEHCDALQRLNQLEDAATCYGTLLAEAPYIPQAHYNLGLARQALKQHAAAAQSFRNAIGLQPRWAEAHVNLALALQSQRHFIPAEQSSRQALRLNPNLPEALFAHGNVLREMGRFEAAITQLSLAVRRHPAAFNARHNLGLALRQMGRLPEAEAAYAAALAMAPDHPTLRYNLGELALLAGRLTDGWENLEYRWLLEGKPRLPFNTPRWDGQVVPTGTLLLYAEQGLGDTLEFCRYVPLAAARARTILMVTPETRRLMESLHPDVPVLTLGGPVPDHVFQCPLLSLPRVFGTTLETIPGTTPYLHADPAAAARWQARLAPIAGLRVGLVWAGNAGFLYDHLRSIPLASLQPLLALPGTSFVSLQKGPAAAQLQALPPGACIHDWTAELVDMADTAALIEGLDLVIGVDTAVIHLAGALGKPTWMLNRFDADWRWLLARDDSPWYPTLRQFRQPQPGDWKSAIARIATALSTRVRTASGSQ